MKFLKLSKYVYIVAGSIFTFMILLLITFSTFKIEKSKTMIMEAKSLNHVMLKTSAANANLLRNHKNIIVNLDGESIPAEVLKMEKGTSNDDKGFYFLEISGLRGRLIPDTSVRVSVIYDETTLLNNLLGL